MNITINWTEKMHQMDPAMGIAINSVPVFAAADVAATTAASAAAAAVAVGVVVVAAVPVGGDGAVFFCW